MVWRWWPVGSLNGRRAVCCVKVTVAAPRTWQGTCLLNAYTQGTLNVLGNIVHLSPRQTLVPLSLGLCCRIGGQVSPTAMRQSDLGRTARKPVVQQRIGHNNKADRLAVAQHVQWIIATGRGQRL